MNRFVARIDWSGVAIETSRSGCLGASESIRYYEQIDAIEEKQMNTASRSTRPVRYPSSDGKRMAENTLQFQWIVMIKENLEVLFRDRPDVFVAGDLLWYPEEGNNKLRQAPDAMVAFGREKGHRRSYLQWLEGNIAPQVVFEILSPGNHKGELQRKFEFYERYGVEEYYIYDPDRRKLEGYQLKAGSLTPIRPMNGWTSPRLGIRFDMSGDTLVIRHPDGQPFLTTIELNARANAAELATEKLREQLRSLGVEPLSWFANP